MHGKAWEMLIGLQRNWLSHLVPCSWGPLLWALGTHFLLWERWGVRDLPAIPWERPQSIWFSLTFHSLDSFPFTSLMRTLQIWDGKLNLPEGPAIFLRLPHFFLRGGREKMGPGFISHSRERPSLSKPLLSFPFSFSFPSPSLFPSPPVCPCLPIPLLYSLGKIHQGANSMGMTPLTLGRPRPNQHWDSFFVFFSVWLVCSESTFPSFGCSLIEKGKQDEKPIRPILLLNL